MKDFYKAIFAGIMISIGGIAYLSVYNVFITYSSLFGSFLFAFGLFTICSYSLNLFTGKIGYFFDNDNNYKKMILITLVGNFVGTFIVALLYKQCVSDGVISQCDNIVKVKLERDLVETFVLSIFCGVMMYLGVDLYKKNTGVMKVVPIFLAVMIFILSGFEHCVANMFYFSLSMSFSLRYLVVLSVMILGNSTGSILINFLLNKCNKDKNEGIVQ